MGRRLAQVVAKPTLVRANGFRKVGANIGRWDIIPAVPQRVSATEGTLIPGNSTDRRRWRAAARAIMEGRKSLGFNFFSLPVPPSAFAVFLNEPENCV